MTPAEAGMLLTIAATYDNRKPDPDHAKAWAMVLDGLRFEDCRDAIVAHYRTSRDWMMPVDVLGGVKRIRTARLREFGPIPSPDHLDADSETFTDDYVRYMAEATRAIADGDLLPGQEVPRGELKPRDIAELGHVGQDVRDA